MKFRPTKKEWLIGGAIVVLLAAGVTVAWLAPQWLKPADQTTKQPNSIDQIQGLRAKGKNDEANAKADTALSQANLSKDERYALYSEKALAALGKNDYAAALDAFTKASQVKEDASIYTSIGEANFALGKKAEAKTAWQKALTLIDNSSPRAESTKADLQQRIDLIDGKTQP